MIFNRFTLSGHSRGCAHFACTIFAVLAGSFVPAVADEPNAFCAAVPRQQWVSAAEVGQKLRKAGYELIRLRMADDKCYGALARDAKGRVHDLVVHPVTVEIMR
ncbi:MAG TPA: PepSY domain-containing protein [Rhabdaerophilum sp.]|nr:PepSY domain-containing protein [Rhabdaerophilum sp.]